jgi:hypothetical protein
MIKRIEEKEMSSPLILRDTLGLGLGKKWPVRTPGDSPKDLGASQDRASGCTAPQALAPIAKMARWCLAHGKAVWSFTPVASSSLEIKTGLDQVQPVARSLTG